MNSMNSGTPASSIVPSGVGGRMRFANRVIVLSSIFLKYCCVIKFFVYICLTLIIKTEYYGITSIKHIDKQLSKSKI